MNGKMGAKATGEKWRDHYRTIKAIKRLVAKMYNTKDWFDPCPANPAWDAFTIKWGKKCYINPPFSEYLKWVLYGLTQPGEQIWFCCSNTETQYYQMLLRECSAVVFPDHRIPGINPNTGEMEGRPRNRHTFFYRGNRPKRFLRIFGDLGYGVLLNNGRMQHGFVY